MNSKGYGTNIVLPEVHEEVWMWRHQENWCCMCKYGSYQSPLQISTDLTIENQDTKVAFSFEKAKGAYAVYNGHQVEIFGGFGEIIHAVGLGRIDYKILKLTFKFPSEHFLNEIQYDGEAPELVISADFVEKVGIALGSQY